MRRPFSGVRVGVMVIAAIVTAANPAWLSPVRAASSPFATEAVVSAGAIAQVNASLDRGVMRSRLVALDANGLPDPRTRSQLAREPALSLQLFPDVEIVAAFDRFDPNATGVTWVGHVDGVPGSSVTFAYGGGLMTGSIITPTAVFQIRPAPENVRVANRQAAGEVHVVEQVDQAAFPEGAPPLVPAISPEALAPADLRMMADSGATVDVMVVYTAVAQQWAGGVAGITNLINLGVSQTNTSYVNSDIKQRLRLVHSALVPYTEGNGFSANLNNLRQGGGTLSTVPALRDQFKADLVMMLIHPPDPDFCGIAYIMQTVSTAFATSAFSVSDTSCVSPVLVMAHEWGHNMGANHDWYVEDSVRPFTYAHGYANTKPGQRWRTVMSYNDVCADQGFSCTRLVAWANPDAGMNPLCNGATAFTCRPNLWYVPGDGGGGIRGGTRTNCIEGVIPALDCDADDHRTLNNTALTIANLRLSGTSTTSSKR